MARYNAFAGPTVTLASVFIPLALIFIVLRIIARSRTKANVGLDDLLAVFTLVIYICYSAMCLWCTWSSSVEIERGVELIDRRRKRRRVYYGAPGSLEYTAQGMPIT